MDENDQSELPTAGERLRIAREEKGLSLEEVAEQTRIPRRHLESIELGDWSKLPAPTYTIGFAKSYATAIGVDRVEIGDQLRAEMGRTRPETGSSEVFEPADPARTMPKWLVLSALAAIVLLVLILTWLNNRSLEPPAEQTEEVAQSTAAAPTQSAPAPQPVTAQGPVVLSATAPVWVRVREAGETLFEGEMAVGQSFQVPATAAAPTLTAGKPEALRITVGSAVAPPVGPPGRVASNVSLAPADLMRGGNAAAPTGGTPAPTQ